MSAPSSINKTLPINIPFRRSMPLLNINTYFDPHAEEAKDTSPLFARNRGQSVSIAHSITLGGSILVSSYTQLDTPNAYGSDSEDDYFGVLPNSAPILERELRSSSVFFPEGTSPKFEGLIASTELQRPLPNQDHCLLSANWKREGAIEVFHTYPQNVDHGSIEFLSNATTLVISENNKDGESSTLES